MKINYRKYIKENKKDFFDWLSNYTNNRKENMTRSMTIIGMYLDNIKCYTIAQHFGVTKQTINGIILRNATKFYYAKN